MGRFWEFCSVYISMRDACKTAQLPKFIEMIFKEGFVSWSPFKYCYFCISRKFFLVARQQRVKITFITVRPLLRMRMLKYSCLQFQCLTSHAHHMRALLKGICTVCELSTDRGKRGRGMLNKHLYLSLSTNAVSQGTCQASDADWVCVCSRWAVSVSLYICVREKILLI